MEKLLACSILWNEELITKNVYQTILDALFIDYPDNELLLELEWNADMKNAIAITRRYFSEIEFDYSIFGHFLIQKLKEIYDNSNMDIYEYGGRMYELWKSLPDCLQHIEPFHTLSYADDPLSWGDEKQTREIYEELFKYYEGR